MPYWYGPILVFFPFLITFFACSSLLSGTAICSRLVLHIFSLSIRVGHFPKDPWFLLLRNSIRNPDLGSRCAHGCWGIIATKPSQMRALRKWVTKREFTENKVGLENWSPPFLCCGGKGRTERTPWKDWGCKTEGWQFTLQLEAELQKENLILATVILLGKYSLQSTITMGVFFPTP